MNFYQTHPLATYSTVNHGSGVNGWLNVVPSQPGMIGQSVQG